METVVYNQEGKKVGTYVLPDGIFNVTTNTDLIHQVLVAQDANARESIAHTKNRAEVRGGGIKPWRQKGTGRARHGSIRSPLWKGGGVSFGPRNEKIFALKINKKQKQKALFMVLSSKVKNEKLAVLDMLTLEKIKTKDASNILKIVSDAAFSAEGYKKILVILPTANKNVTLSMRNIPNVKSLTADSLNIKDLLSYRYVILVKDSVEVIEKTYTQLAPGKKGTPAGMTKPVSPKKAAIIAKKAMRKPAVKKVAKKAKVVKVKTVKAKVPAKTKTKTKTTAKAKKVVAKKKK